MSFAAAGPEAAPVLMHGFLAHLAELIVGLQPIKSCPSVCLFAYVCMFVLTRLLQIRAVTRRDLGLGIRSFPRT